MEDKNELIDKALFNMTELMKLRREETKLVARLYIGILQKKYPDTRIMLTTPKAYRVKYNYDYRGSKWDAKDKKLGKFSWEKEYTEEIKHIKVIAIGEGIGLVAKLEDPDFLKLLGGKDKVVFGVPK